MEEKSCEKSQLIHCITNPISMTNCANAILALGARPIMAEHPDEVTEITRTASSLLLNLGNITDVRMTSMRLSLKEANRIGIPVTLDAVGVSCSMLRKTYTKLLLTTGKFACIKGNYSEILALTDDTYKSSGVDAAQDISQEQVEKSALEFSKRTGAIIVATGKTDIVAFDGRIERISGGSKMMSQVTGTGCMLGAVITTYLAFENNFESVTRACRFFKSCGVKAETTKGLGTYMVNLMDAIGEKDEI